MDESKEVEAVVHRIEGLGWMQYNYKYNHDVYAVEVPITDNNKHLVNGEKITLSMSMKLKDK